MIKVRNSQRLFLLAFILVLFLIFFVGQAAGFGESLIIPSNRLLAPNDNVSLGASQDTYVDEGSPTTNYGLNSILFVGRSEFLQESYSLLSFNLASIPAGSTINSASLELYLENGGSSSQSLTVYRVASSWTSTAVTYNTRPSLGGTYGSTNVSTTSGLFYTWDITSLVSYWLNGTYTNYGVAMRGPGVASWGKTFSSSNAGISANRPRLVIEFTPPTPTPTITPTGTITPEATHTPTPTEALGSIGNLVWNDVDHDGFRDPGEPGIGGVGLNLIGGSVVLDTDVTNGSGGYLFSNLPAGNYTVDIDDWTLPPGYLLTSGTEPRAVTIGAGENNLTVDFGYASPPTPTPTATTIPDLDADWLEVTQGIQNLHNDVRLVANKRTYVRFHAHAIGGIYETTAVLHVQRGGAEAWLRALNPGAAINVPGFSRPLSSRTQLDRAFLFELPDGFREGTVTLTAYLNPTSPILPRPRDPIETNYTNNSVSTTVSFENVPQLNLSLVRIGVNSTGVAYFPPFSDSIALYRWLLRAYPVHRVQATFLTLGWGAGSVDSDGSLTNPNCGGVNGWIGSVVPSGAGVRRAYGFVDDRNGYMRGCSGVPSWTASGPAGVPGVNSNPAAASLWDTDGTYVDWYGGHEIGHSLGRSHAPFCDAAGSAFYPYPGGRISPNYWVGGSLGESQTLTGFDITSRTIYSRHWADVMTYCQRQWISDFTYEAIMDYLQANGTVATTRQIAEPADRLLVMGEIDEGAGTATLETLFVLPASEELEPRVPGDYAIVLRSSGGSELARYPFTPRVTESGPPSPPGGGGEIQTLTIFETVPFVSGTDRVDIEGPGGTILTTVTAGSAVPSVSLTQPTGGETLSGDPITVAWTASDSDPDQLSFLVQYSPDDGITWEIVDLPTTENSIEIDAGNFVSGGQARVRVLASDGVHTSSDTSGQVIVPNRIPSVTILEPATGLTMAVEQTLALEAFAIDVDSGTMPAAQLVWSSNLDGELGTGATTVVTGLSVGTHTITITADDSAGGVATDSVQVTVLADPEDIPLLPDGLVIGPDIIVLETGLGIDSQLLAIDNQDHRSIINWTASASEIWVGLSATSGVTPDDLVVSYDDQGLPVGTYTATITFTSPDVGGESITIDVQLIVGSIIFLPTIER